MRSREKLIIFTLFVCVLLSGAAAIYNAFTVRRLQKDIEFIRQDELSEAYASENFAAGLRNEEIESILLVGDSISDNNGASGHIYEQEQRRDAGCRLILSDEEEGAYYEDSPDARGWGWHFRNYLLENTSATTFHNNAIGGKSAKWFNAHREQAIPQDYDAIIVMLGTNDRRTCADVDEFYREYGEFLAYAADHCEYLQVFAPSPRFIPLRMRTK